jgi:hypothetical protein
MLSEVPIVKKFQMIYQEWLYCDKGLLPKVIIQVVKAFLLVFSSVKHLYLLDRVLVFQIDLESYKTALI